MTTGPDRNQLKMAEIYFGLQFQRVAVHDGREGILEQVGTQGWKLFRSQQHRKQKL